MADTSTITGSFVQGVPEISSKEEYDALDDGNQFIKDGKVFTKGRKQRNIPAKEQAYEWGMQDEVINMMLAGYGDEVYGALDWLAAKIVPDDAFGIDRGPDPTLAQAQEKRRQAQRLYRETDPGAATVGQIVGGVTPSAVVGKAGQALIKALPQLAKIPTYLRGITGAAVQAGVTASGEADPGERLERAETGAETGAIISATLQPISAAGSFISRTASGRINPTKSARNIVNNAMLQSNLARAETATEEELAQLPEEIRNLPPHLRRTARRLDQLGSDATIADAARGGAVRTVANVATQVAGPASERAEGLLSERGTGESVRIVQSIDDFVSSAYGSPEQISTTLVESAQPYYDQAFGITRNEDGDRDFTAENSTNQDLMSPTIARIISTPNGIDAFNSAIKSMQNEFGWDQRLGDQAKKILNELISRARRDSRGAIIGLPNDAPGLSLEFLDQVKIQLQQEGQRLKNVGGRKRDSSIAMGQAAELIEQLDVLDETQMYGVARGIAQDNILLQQAYQDGMGALGPKGSVKAILDLVSGYTPGQRAMFQAGAANYLRDKILKTPERGQAAQSVFGNKLIMNKLAAIIDDKEDLAAFRKAITQEKTYALTQRRVLGGGGPQAQPAGTGKDIVGTVAALAGSKLPGANPLITAGLFRRYGQALMGASTNEEVTRILLTRDPEENRQFLTELAQFPTDPEAMRLRQLVERAVAQQFETKRERYQVPTGRGGYRLKDFDRSMTRPKYYGETATNIYSQSAAALADVLSRLPSFRQKETE
tara:strand:- start:3574 stop:5895 length:2322 start_codon:yes stop_codon:yes gene_type:complete